MEYESIGEMELSEANEMNVPVNIFLTDEDEEGVWELTAANFMPRRMLVSDDQYHLRAKSKEALIAAVNKYVVPLYEAALINLKTCGSNYYWKVEKE